MADHRRRLRISALALFGLGILLWLAVQRAEAKTTMVLISGVSRLTADDREVHVIGAVVDLWFETRPGLPSLLARWRQTLGNPIPPKERTAVRQRVHVELDCTARTTRVLERAAYDSRSRRLDSLATPESPAAKVALRI